MLRQSVSDVVVVEHGFKCHLVGRHFAENVCRDANLLNWHGS